MKNISEFNQTQVIGTELPRPQISTINSQAEACMNVVLKELRSACPAWRNAIKTKKELDDVKRTWTKAFIENGVVSMSVIEKGLAVARNNPSDFFPSVGRFIGWCRSDDFINCFERFMSRKKPRNHFESLVFDDAERNNTRRKAIGDDERTFKKSFNKWVKRFASGDIPQQVKALPPKSVVMPIDIARERMGKVDPSMFPKDSAMYRAAVRGLRG